MAKRCVLIVDDDEAIAHLCRRFLERADFTVLVAGDGIEALNLLQETKPDIIVTDVGMPRLGGYGLYDAVRARPGWETIPFVFLTGNAGTDGSGQGPTAGLAGYLPKPFLPMELLEAVRLQLQLADNR